MAVLFGGTTFREAGVLGIPGAHALRDVAAANVDGTDATTDLVGLTDGTGEAPILNLYFGESDRLLRSRLRVLDSRKVPPVQRTVTRVVAGRFTSASEESLVVFSEPVDGNEPPAISAVRIGPIDGPQLGQLGGIVDLAADTDATSLGTVAADLDGDGLDELVLFAYPRLGDVSIAEFTAQGASVMTAFAGDGGEDFSWTRPIARDVDGDGRTDLTALAWVSDTPMLEIFYGDGSGTLAASRRIVLAPPPAARPLGWVFDWINVDADPRVLDLAFYDGTDVVLGRVDRNAGQIVVRAKLPRPPAPPRELKAGDFDGDGLADLAYNGLGLEIYWGKAAHPSL
jgi:hypothetical protein